MIRHRLAVLAAALFAALGLPGAGAAAQAAPADAAAATTAKSEAVSQDAAAPKIPSEIIMPSSVGEIRFPHEKHFRDLSVKCADCHHQINAKALNTPHPDYFRSSWINCKICHKQSNKPSERTFVCSQCHIALPKNIADETLSAKVVIHEQCWKCHVVGTGKEASKACAKCHSGKKSF